MGEFDPFGVVAKCAAAPMRSRRESGWAVNIGGAQGGGEPLDAVRIPNLWEAFDLLRARVAEAESNVKTLQALMRKLGDERNEARARVAALEAERERLLALLPKEPPAEVECECCKRTVPNRKRDPGPTVTMCLDCCCEWYDGDRPGAGTDATNNAASIGDWVRAKHGLGPIWKQEHEPEAEKVRAAAELAAAEARRKTDGA